MQNQTIANSTFPQHVSAPEPDMTRRLSAGAIAGAAGAGILAGIMYSMWAANKGPKPLFLDAQQKQFGEHGTVDHVAGVGRFVAWGALWGAGFGVMTGKPTAIKGAAFGFLPSLFLWTVLAPMQGEKLFFGGEPKKIGMPVLFNSVIWGSFIGKAAQMNARSLLH